MKKGSILRQFGAWDINLSHESGEMRYSVCGDKVILIMLETRGKNNEIVLEI